MSQPDNGGKFIRYLSPYLGSTKEQTPSFSKKISNGDIEEINFFFQSTGRGIDRNNLQVAHM